MKEYVDRTMKLNINIGDLRKLTKEKLDRVLFLFTDGNYNIDEVYKFIHKDSYDNDDEFWTFKKIEAFCQGIDGSSMLNIMHTFDCDVKIQSAGKQWYVEVGTYIQVENEQVIDAYWQVILKIADAVHERKKEL